MSNLQIIDRLCEIVEKAAGIIKQQAELLEQHGIHTETGAIEEDRARLLSDIEKFV